MLPAVGLMEEEVQRGGKQSRTNQEVAGLWSVQKGGRPSILGLNGAGMVRQCPVHQNIIILWARQQGQCRGDFNEIDLQKEWHGWLG